MYLLNYMKNTWTCICKKKSTIFLQLVHVQVEVISTKELAIDLINVYEVPNGANTFKVI